MPPETRDNPPGRLGDLLALSEAFGVEVDFGLVGPDRVGVFLGLRQNSKNFQNLIATLTDHSRDYSMGD